MPTYEVTSPDGRTFEVTAPDGATKDDVLAYAQQQFASLAAPEQKEKPKTTLGGYLKELPKAVGRGAVGLLETSGIGASALLPDEMEQQARAGIKGLAEPARQFLAPGAGYEETIPTKLAEGVGSTLPFFALGPAGIAGRIGAAGLGVAAGAGEARQAAEQAGATPEQRSRATLLGAPTGFLDVIAPEIGPFKNLLVTAAARGGVEGLTEAAQKVAQNLIAKGVYNPNQEIMVGAGEEGAYGAGVGALTSLIVDLTLGRRAHVPSKPSTGVAPAGEEPATLPPEKRFTGFDAEKAAALRQEAQPAQPPLALGMNAPFTPVSLPDGSVAMTQAELDQYEQEAFRKKYEPQPNLNQVVAAEKPPLLGYSPLPGTLVGLPGGQVALTPEQEFQARYAPQPVRMSQERWDRMTPEEQGAYQAAAIQREQEAIRQAELEDVRKGIKPRKEKQTAFAPEELEQMGVTVPERKKPIDRSQNPDNIGVAGEPIVSGGTPFATKEEASEARRKAKLTDYTVAKTDQGYVLSPLSAEELAARDARTRKIALPQTTQAGMPQAAHELIAEKGGISPEVAKEIGIQGNVRVGNRPLVAAKGKGLTADQVRSALESAGYQLPEGATDDQAVQMVAQSIRRPVYTPEGYQRIGTTQAEQDARAAEKQEAVESLTTPMAEELGYPSFEGTQEESNSALALARDYGLDTEAIQEQAHYDTVGKPDEAYHRRITELVRNEVQGKSVLESAAKGEKGSPAATAEEKKMEKDLTGKTLVQAAQYAVKNAPNKFYKFVAQKVLNKINAMQNAGVEFRFHVLGGDARPKFMRSSRGVTELIFGMKGEPTVITVALNGSPVVQNQLGYPSGMNYRTLLHELLHAVTRSETHFLKYVGADHKAVKDLRKLYSQVVEEFNRQQEAGTLPEFLQDFAAGQNNALSKPDELLTWGMTDERMQRWLSEIKVGEKSAFGKLVEYIREVLGIAKNFETALDRLVRTTDEIIDIDLRTLENGMQAQGYMLGPKPMEKAAPAKAAPTEDRQQKLFMKEFARTPEFKKWFGKSKIVNADGSPKVMYHGTMKDFETFDISRAGSATPTEGTIPAKAFFVSPSPEAASQYAADVMKIAPGGNVMPLYVKADNPFDYENSAHIQKVVNELNKKTDRFGAKLGDKNKPWIGRGKWEDLERPEVQQAIKDAGFDAFYVEEGGYKNLGVFEPNQLKSVFNLRPTAERTSILASQEGLSNEARQALEILEGMGRTVGAPDPTVAERAKAFVNDAMQNPKGTAQEAQSTFRRLADRVETWTFSSDAALNNQIRDSVMQSTLGQETKIGLLLNASLSQTAHSDAVSNLFLRKGNIRYNEELHKWEGVDSEDNIINLSKQLDQIAEKNGLTKQQIELIAHTAFEAKRTQSLIKFNEELAAQVEELRAAAAEERAKGNAVKASALSEKASNLKSKTKFIHMEPQDIQSGLQHFKLFPELNKVVKTWNGMRQNAVDVMVKTGLWSQEDADFMLSNADYVPFYREDQIEQGKGPKEFMRNLQVQARERRLKGSNKPVNDIFDNMVRWTQYAINRSVRNRSAVALAQTAENVGLANKIHDPNNPNNVGVMFDAQGNPTLEVMSKNGVMPFSSPRQAAEARESSGDLLKDYSVLQIKVKEGDKEVSRYVLSPPMPADNVVYVWQNGERVGYSMQDPMFMEAFQGLESVSIPTIRWAAKMADWLRQSVVLYPLFSIAQVPQDSFAAMFSSGLKPRYALSIPLRAVKEFVQTLRGTSKAHEQLKNVGAAGVRDFTSAGIREDAEVAAGLKAQRGLWGRATTYLGNVAMAADNAVRQAVYTAAIDQGLSPAEAIEKSFEIFNVRRKGSSKMLALAGQVIPFFNAYLAAQHVAYRTITGVSTSPTERAEAYKVLASTTASVMALSLLYAMMNGDDDDYLKKPTPTRDRLLMIPGTGGLSIPLRSDLFALPKVFTEHMYLLLTDNGYEDGAKFRSSMASLLGNSILSPTVVPQAVKPLAEVIMNYDFFQQKPLIGVYQQKKDVARQFEDSTSELAKVLGSAGVVSPIAIDHLVRGMFGSVGGLVLYATNPVLAGVRGVERPSLSMQDALATIPNASGFISKEYESALRKDFYALAEEVQRASNTLGDLKSKSPEEIKDYLADPKVQARIGMAPAVNQISNGLTQIRRAVTQITNDSRMSDEEKATRIRALRQQEDALLKSVNLKKLREMAQI